METIEYHKMRSLESENWWYLARIDLIQHLLSKYAPHFDSILDIGCGTGSILEKYPSKKCVGVEQNPIAIQYAKEKGLTIQPSLEKVHGTFDVVLMMDVLEHVKEDHAFLKKALEHVNENGILVITVPAFQWMWSTHDDLVHHVRRYNKKMVKEMIAASGGKCVHASYWNASFFLPAIVKKKVFSSDESDLGPVHPVINSTALSVLKMENRFSSNVPLPLGTSVYAIVKK